MDSNLAKSCGLLSLLTLSFVFGEMGHFLLGVTSRSMAKEIHFGDKSCVDTTISGLTQPKAGPGTNESLLHTPCSSFSTKSRLEQGIIYVFVFIKKQVLRKPSFGLFKQKPWGWCNHEYPLIVVLTHFILQLRRTGKPLSMGFQWIGHGVSAFGWSCFCSCLHGGRSFDRIPRRRNGADKTSWSLCLDLFSGYFLHWLCHVLLATHRSSNAPRHGVRKALVFPLNLNFSNVLISLRTQRDFDNSIPEKFFIH